MYPNIVKLNYHNSYTHHNHNNAYTQLSDIELLKITYDTLILQITSKSFLKDNVPYEYSVTSWIGDAIRLEVDVEDIEHGITFLK